MDSILQQIYDLLTTPPGNLVYHLVLGFAVIAALQAILMARRFAPSIPSSRPILGLSLLILSQGAIFIITGLAWQGFADLRAVLPPSDRFITASGLLLIIWLWAVPRPSRLWDALTAVIFTLITVAFLFTLANWSANPPSQKFNTTFYDQVWEVLSLSLTALGIIILIIRRPQGWGVGLAVLFVNLTGHAVQFFWPAPEGDLSGPVRLAQLCTYPLLPSLAQRFHPTLTPSQPASVAPTSTSTGVFKERRKHSADPRAVFAWMQLAIQTDPDQSFTNLSRAIAQTMLADLCYIVSAPTAQSDLVLHGGYDLIREEPCPPTRINRESVPNLANAAYRGRSARLGSDSAPAPDLQAVAEALGLQDCGNILLIPLASTEHSFGAVLLLAPYSNRTWTPEDQSYFLTSIDSIVRFLQRSSTVEPEVHRQPSPTSEPPVTTLHSAELESLRSQAETLRQDNQLLLSELADLRLEAPSSPAAPELKQAQEAISRLQQENHRLVSQLQSQFPAAYAEKSLEVEQLEQEIRHSLEECAHLQNSLAEANMQILTLQKRADQPIRAVSEDREVIASIAQELRQPLASITGYTELLLSESAGILGALQRKFLERVKSSTERMRSILDELVRLTNIQNVPLELIIQPIHPAEVIDQAVADTRAQLQEMSITLQIDLIEQLPDLFTDRDAFCQVVTQLLQNAISASPAEGIIRLRTALEGQDTSSPYLLLQFTDSGGGIDPQDLPRVFSRRYRADHALIQGVGDSGVGLSIAKTLVEAHGGRIWVDTEPGKTTTFSALFPIRIKGATGAGASDETVA